MKPPIITLSPVCAKARVLILVSCDAIGAAIVVAAIAQVLASPARQPKTNNGRRSFFIFGELRLAKNVDYEIAFDAKRWRQPVKMIVANNLRWEVVKFPISDRCGQFAA